MYKLDQNIEYSRNQYFNMSSSNNLDEKLLLKYISVTFQGWGMGYATPEVLRQAKKNSDGAVQQLSRLLFDLCLLHNFDYKFTAKELNADFNEDERQMKEIIVAHLFEVECPFVVEQIKGDQIGIGLDFTSSRHLLVVCGWVMAVSNYFGHTNLLFSRTFDAIYKPQPLNFSELMSKVQHFGGIDLKEESDKLTRVAILSRLLRSRKYTIQCLMQKRAKIYKNLRAQLKQIDASLNLQELLGGKNQQTKDLEQQLKCRIAFQKQNMGLRKYWWIWLEQKIIQSEYVQLSGNYQQFQKLQVPLESIKDKVQIDHEFIKKYLQELEFVENKVEQIGSKIQQLSIKPDKPFKQIQRDILEEIKSSNSKSQSLKNISPSFIGMQLQRYLQLQKTITTQQKQTRKQIDKNIQKSYIKLSQCISKSIADIDDIAII